MWTYGRHPIATAENRRRKKNKEEETKIETTAAKHNGLTTGGRP